MTNFLHAFWVWLLVFSAAPALAVPPGEKWFTLETEHFHVHHTEPQAILARSFSAALERAFPRLTKDLGWTPATPIDIVLNDQADSANGFALSVPSNLLEVYTVPFPTESSLADYDNWVEELATHELTHIIANDTGFGAYKTLRSIFGSIVKPNGLQPMWMVEGLAVFEETKQTSGGRGRSLLTEALLRTAALNNKLNSRDYFNLERFNDGVFWWPSSNTAYFLGYTVQAAAEGMRPDSADSSRSVPGLMSANNAHQWPYRVQSNAEDILGHNWYSLWQDTTTLLHEHYPMVRNDQENPAFCQLTRGGRFTGGAALAKDGWIYFSYEHPDQGSVLARVRADGDCHKPNVQVLADRKLDGGTPQVSLSPDDRYVAYSELAISDSFHQFNELRLYDTKNGSIRPIAPKTRAWDPAFTPNGDLVFVRNLGNSQQALSLIKKENFSGEAKDLFVSRYFERLSHPFVSGNTVYFSRHNNGGQDEILALNIENGTAKPVIDSAHFHKGTRFIEQSPYLDEDGDLYFSGYYSGDSDTRSLDIYVLPKGKQQPRKLVQSASGFLDHPIPYYGQLLAVNYGLNGFDLVRIDRNDSKNLIAGLPKQKQSLHEVLVGSQEASPAPEPALLPLSDAKDVPYSVFKTPASSLWPHYWLPTFQLVPDGINVGAGTSGGDPLAINTYDLSILYDSRANFPLYAVDYSNWYFPVGISVFARQTNSYFQGSQTSNRNAVYAAEATFPFYPWSFSVGGALQEKHYFYSSNRNPFVFTDIHYSEARKTPSAIALNQGALFDSYLAYFPANNIERTFVDWRPELDFYIPGFLRSHSFATSLRAGITTNRYLATNYYLGGGVSSVGNDNDFIVRGYPSDVLLGQRIASANFAYTIPISRPYVGWGTNPFFFREFGARFLFDAGSATYVAHYSGATFEGYEQQHLGGRTLYGVGGELLFRNTVLYYVPFNINLGVHHGLQKAYGGETTLYLGLNVDIPGLSHSENRTPQAL